MNNATMTEAKKNTLATIKTSATADLIADRDMMHKTVEKATTGDEEYLTLWTLEAIRKELERRGEK